MFKGVNPLWGGLRGHISVCHVQMMQSRQMAANLFEDRPRLCAKVAANFAAGDA